MVLSKNLLKGRCQRLSSTTLVHVEVSLVDPEQILHGRQRVRTLPKETQESNAKKTNTYLLETNTVAKCSSWLEHGVESRGARCPETGQVRTCGARPHRSTQRENIDLFHSHGKMKHFSRRATSADSGSECRWPGFLRLSPVRRLFCRQRELIARTSSKPLYNAWEVYPGEKMRSVWLCLYDSFHGIMEVAGWND